VASMVRFMGFAGASVAIVILHSKPASVIAVTALVLVGLVNQESVITIIVI